MNGQTIGARKTDMLYAGNVDTFSPTTSPSSAYPANDYYSGLVIEQVSTPADQMTAYVSQLPFPCTTVTDTLPNHETAGRVYGVEEGFWWTVTRYYAYGSDEDLGTSSTAQVALSEISSGYYTAEGCPAGDTTAPVITLQGDSVVSVVVGNAYVEPGYDAIDNVDGDVTGSVTVVSNVDTNVIGEYQVTYNVSDAAGNVATEVVRTVHVIEASACTDYSSTVASHISAGRAYACGLYNYYGCAVGSGTYLGSRYTTTVVTVKEETAGYYDLGSCN